MWLSLVSGKCQNEERHFEKHFNPNYVPVVFKITLPRKVVVGWMLFMNRHFKHIRPRVTMGRKTEQLNRSKTVWIYILSRFCHFSLCVAGINAPKHFNNINDSMIGKLTTSFWTWTQALYFLVTTEGSEMHSQTSKVTLFIHKGVIRQNKEVMRKNIGRILYQLR